MNEIVLLWMGAGTVMLTTAAAAFYALHLGIKLSIKIGAMEKSTHQIQYVDASLPTDPTDEMLNRAIGQQEHDEWDGIDKIHQKSEPLM